MKSTLNLRTLFLSLLVMALWGSLFPMVKIGYEVFEINGSDIPSILMFAGTRFALCGAIVCFMAFLKKDKIKAPKIKTFGMILLIGLFSIILHYAFTYIGLSSTDSSKTALIKQLGSLIYVCFAFLFFKNETYSIWKIIGAIIGFFGIIAINFNPGGISFSFGDILIILASVCTVVASILSKKTLENNSPFWITGISQLSGGIVLLFVALIMGADFLSFNLDSLLVFTYICTASMVAYLLWNNILKTCELSNMFIIKFAEPLFACIFGAILLSENIFKWQYLIAFILISAGITLGNKKVRNNKMKSKIFEIKRFAVHDGDGIRTTVFFKGCPLRCLWCHNPEGLSAKYEVGFYEHKCIGCGECQKNGFSVSDCLGGARVEYGKEVSVSELLPILLEDKEFFDNSDGGVTLSGGECLMWADFCAELLKELKANGVHTAVDTCGYVPSESLDKVIPYTDVFLYDFKAYDEDVHIRCTGKSNKLIIENLKYLDSIGKQIEIRIPYIPEHNSEQIEKMADFLKNIKNITKIRLLPYHNYSESKYKSLGIASKMPEKLPTDEEIAHAKELLRKSGHTVI